MYDARERKSWTPDETKRRVAEALGRIYGALGELGAEEFRNVDGDIITAAHFIKLVRPMVDPNDWPKLVLWAKVQVGLVQLSFESACRHWGWSPDTGHRAVKNACIAIAGRLEEARAQPLIDTAESEARQIAQG